MWENTKFVPINGNHTFYREADYRLLPVFKVFAKVRRHGEEVWWPIGFISSDLCCHSYSYFHGYYPPNPIGIKFKEFAERFLKETKHEK